jgi:hypothetical protein
MYCNSCGAPNPDDASFCSKCGKPVAGSPTIASSPRDLSEPALLAEAREYPSRGAAKITPVASPAESPRASAKKKRGVRWGWIATTCIVLLIVLYPLRNGGGICDTARNQVIQQVPPAVEILAARYPLQVGLLHSAFNDKGIVDGFAQEYVRAYMYENQQEPGRLSCYLSYYVVMFNKDGMRTSIADWLEKRLQLK